MNAAKNEPIYEKLVQQAPEIHYSQLPHFESSASLPAPPAAAFSVKTAREEELLEASRRALREAKMRVGEFAANSDKHG
jgi:hypothetical protein